MKFFFQYLENPDKDKPLDTYWSDPSVEDLKGAFAESLLFGDSVTIKLAYGSISKLADWLGIGLLEELLDEKIVQFCALNSIGTAYITNEMIKVRGAKISPGLGLIFGTEPEDTTIYGRVFRDLEEKTQFSRKDRGRLTRMVEKNCALVEDDIIHAACSAARIDITGEIGKELGFPIHQNPDSGDLKKPNIRQYLRVTTANLNLQLAAKFRCDNLIANRITSRILEKRVVDALRTVKISAADYRTLLQLEEVPDFGKLFREDKISFEQVFKISRTKEAQAFREWLNSIEPSDRLDITRKYQRGLINRSFDSTFVKTIKVFGYTSIGAVSALLDPSGVASGLVLNTFDAFILDALKRKWSPKIFLDQLKEIESN